MNRRPNHRCLRCDAQGHWPQLVCNDCHADNVRALRAERAARAERRMLALGVIACAVALYVGEVPLRVLAALGLAP